MSDPVVVREEPLTIPTYPVGECEPCPMFYAGRAYQGAQGPVYPYPLRDRLSDVRQDRTYRAVYLENRYVEICVLPEIGGRIFSARDKTNGYDFVYRQHVIKPSLIGMLGAWISGGVEWNIPHHHRPTTFDPIDYRIVANADGGKTVWVGEIEWRHRLQWAVGLTLHPDRSYLEVTTRIFNRTPLVHSFLCFTNLAVHVNDTYQVIFPPATEFGTQHAKCEFIRWPVAEGAYAGVDYSGVDISWWKNHPTPLSIFAWNERDDFFGGYDHGKQAGIVHFADHHVVPGKKFFTFGNGSAGQMWDKILTDGDGPYVELMAGAYSDNQPDYSWIQPGEAKTVTQYWYPVRQLGGIKNANRDASVNLEVQGGLAHLAFNATADLEAVTVQLRAGDKTLLAREIALSPDRPFACEIPLPPGARPQDLRASLRLPSGEELIGYQPPQPSGAAAPSPVIPPPRPQEIANAEELTLAGERLEQFHSPALESEPYYLEALRRDEGDIRANTDLGILYCRRWMWAQAEVRLARAVDRLSRNYTRPKDGESLYYLGLALNAQGKRAQARDALNRCAWCDAWRGQARLVLAEMACQDGDEAAAMACIDEALSANTRNTRAMNLKAALLRKAGRFEEALDLLAAALALAPLDAWARNELVLSLRAAGRPEQSQGECDQLSTQMRSATEAYLELACDYEACGLWEEAVEALTRLAGAYGAKSTNPIIHYALGYYRQRQGRDQDALEHYRRAAAMPPDLCFPFRWETAGWLRAALACRPDDARAQYYLGNLLCDRQPAEAIAAWEESRRLDGAFWLVHRNLGWAYGRAEEDPSRAVESQRRAIECNAGEPRLHLELDQLLEARGDSPAERLALLEQNRAAVLGSSAAVQRLVGLYIQLGRYDSAIELLDGRHFHIWEGGEHSVHDLHVDVHLAKGQGLFAAGRHRQALAEYRVAAEYPDRFEVGEPYDGGRGAEVYYHIGTAHQALGEADLARAAFQRAAGKARKGTDLPYYQGLAWRELGDEVRAAACFDELARLGQEMLAGTGKDFFEKFGDQVGSHRAQSLREAQGRYLLGLGLLGKGDAATARRELAAAVSLNANHRAAQVRLAAII